MVPRKGVGTGRRKATDDDHRPTSRSTISWTRRNSQNYRVGQPTILLAKDAGNNQTIRQKLRHMPTNQGGPACALRPPSTKRGTRITLEIYIDGLHYRLTRVRRT